VARRGARVRAGIVVWLVAAACTPRPEPPIQIDGTILVVRNDTDREWRDVEVWVNDHYRVTASSIPANNRMAIPLSTLVAGFGQRFDPARQGVRGVEVTARDSAGEAVTLRYGDGRRR
jgi:hypothetical protein